MDKAVLMIMNKTAKVMLGVGLALGLCILGIAKYRDSPAQYNGLTDGEFPLCMDSAGQHLNWNGWLPGGGPVCGTSTAPMAIGSPNSNTLSLATAYQATNTAKGAAVNVNLTSTASISLSGGATNTAIIYIGSTNAVASGTGTQICNYSNSNTGSLTIGLNLSTISAVSCHFDLPIGWYYAIRQTAGTVSIVSAFDQSIG